MYNQGNNHVLYTYNPLESISYRKSLAPRIYSPKTHSYICTHMYDIHEHIISNKSSNICKCTIKAIIMYYLPHLQSRLID